jgi:hypothetical protein
MSSHAGDGTAGATWPRHDVDAESCSGWCCQVMLVMHAARVTWLRRDVDVESCW